MAAIFQIRRGTTNETLAEGELYLHKGSGSIQFGSGSIAVTLLPLNTPAYGDINLVGNISASGDVRIGGNIYLGNESVDNISALGQFNTNLVPNGIIDVGTILSPWTNVYATNLYGSVNATNGVISGSSQIAVSLPQGVVSGSSQVIDILSSLNSFSGSQIEKNAELATISGSLISTASANTISITNLNLYTSSQATQNSDLSTYTASVESRFSSLATISGSLISTASSHEVSIFELNIFSGSTKTKLTNLESKSESVDNSLVEIHSYTSSLKTVIGVSGMDVTVLGNLTVNGTTTQINSTQVNIGDNILELNFGGAAAEAGIYTKDATGLSTTSGSLLWDSNVDYWKAGNKGIESKILLAGGDNVISSSLQLIELNSFTQSVNIRLTNLESTSASVNASVTNLNTISSNVNLFTQSADIRLTNLESKSSSVDVSILELNGFTGSQLTQNSALGIYTASVDGRLSTLGTYTASIETRFDEIGIVSGALILTASNHEQRIDELEGKSASVDINISNIHAFSGSQLTQNSTLATYTGSIDTRFTTLSLVTASLIVATASLFVTASDHEARLDQLEYDIELLTPAGLDAAFDALNLFTASVAGTNLFTSSTNIRLTNLEFTSESVNTSVSSLNAFTASLDATFATDAEVAAGYESKGRGIVSGSSQIVSLLPNGVVSGSSQLATDFEKIASATHTLVSGSSQIIGILSSLNTFTSSLDATYATEAEVAAGYESKGRGIISASSQLATDFEKIASVTHTLVSGSSQISGLSNAQLSNSSITISGTSVSLGGSITTSKILEGTNVISSSTQITSLLPIGIVSGSSQISLGSTIGNITLGTQTVGDYVASLVQGTGVTITNNSGENSTPTIAIGQVVSTTANVRFNSIGVDTAASETAGEIRAAGDITAFYSSDVRLKENIVPIPNALEKVNQISGNTYNWKEGYTEIHSHKGNDVGVIAQEIEKILPQIVTNRDNGYKAVQYEKMIPLLIEAIKELSAKVDRLENK